MPAWLHNRAEHLLAKNPSMDKSTAFAIATQQSHKMGKSPKGYGTKQGKKSARAKYDKPRKEYVRGANPGKLNSPKLAEVTGEDVGIGAAGTLAGAGLGLLGAKLKGGRQAARVAKLLKPAGSHVTIGAKARGQWASELPKLDPASQKAIMTNPLVSQGGMAPEMALMHIRDSMKPGDKIVDFLARQKTPQVTSKIGMAHVSQLTLMEGPFFDELSKIAMFPTSSTPVGTTGMQAQKKLKKSQKVGTPDDPKGPTYKAMNQFKPPKMPGMPKVGFATSGFSGPLSMGGFPQASGQAARMNPPTHIMDPNLKTAGPPSEKKAIKEAAARMVKWASTEGRNRI